MNTTVGEHLGIVVVDDDPIFRDIVCATLRRLSRFVIFEAASGDELVDHLERQSIDCIILDYDLGQETGLAVKQRIEDSRQERVPIVMLTGDGRESTAIRAFRMGIADYIPKRGLLTENLVRTVLDVVERSRAERSEAAERRRLLAASSIDAATGLEGRTRLDERLALLAALPTAAGSNYALILVEIVDYDALLGRFGFKIADQALRLVAKRLSALTRSSDICGRYEDGTFLVIADVRADGELLHRICRRFAEQSASRLTSDVADLQLSVRVAAAMAAPAMSDAGPAEGRHPALAFAQSAMDRARLSDTAVVIAAAASPASVKVAADPPPAGADVPFEPPERRPAADELRSEDRRRHPRQRVLRRGLIHLLGKQSTMNCTVRNLSVDGMGLRLEAPCAVPEVFDLEVMGSGTRKRVRVRWQLATDIGVEVVRSGDVDL